MQNDDCRMQNEDQRRRFLSSFCILQSSFCTRFFPLSPPIIPQTKRSFLMPILLNDEALDTIFRKARTHSSFLPQPVSDDLLHQLYNLYKLGPTSANTSPMRVVFVKSQAAKERLKPALQAGNVDKTMAAPVCA